jgi:hypothetical protein
MTPLANGRDAHKTDKALTARLEVQVLFGRPPARAPLVDNHYRD